MVGKEEEEGGMVVFVVVIMKEVGVEKEVKKLVV